MATPNIVPRADSEGGLGTASKYWASAYIDLIYVGAGKMGRDADNLLDFSADNHLTLRLNANNKLVFDGARMYPNSNDGYALGLASNSFSDLFLASGAVINFNNGNVTLTHSSGSLTFADSDALGFGNSNDLKILHDGSDGYLTSNTGHFYIEQKADDSDIIFTCDDGSGGTTAYLTLDGSAGYTLANKDIYFAPGIRAYFGSGGLLSMVHDNSNGNIINTTGDLTITNQADDGDIIFSTDNGSGGTTEYLTLDGANTKINVEAVNGMQFSDNIRIKVGSGTGGDLRIYHNGTTNNIEAVNGNLRLIQGLDDMDITFESDDGAGGITTYFYLDGSSAAHDGSATTELYTNWPDKSYISLGTSHDFSLKHNGVQSMIHNNTGDLYIINYQNDGDISFQSDDGSGGITEYFKLDGTNVRTLVKKNLNVEDDVQLQIGNSQDLKLYHNSSHSYIAQAGVGNLYIQNEVDDGDIIFISDDGSGGTTEYFRVDGGAGANVSSKSIYMADSKRFYAGAGGDLAIYHNGTNSFIENDTGDFYITQKHNDGDIVFQNDDGSGNVTPYITLDGGNVQMVAAVKLAFNDNVRATFGNSSDLQIYHDGTDTRVYNSTGDFIFRNSQGAGDIKFQADDGSGSTTTYLTLDGGDGRIKIPDSKIMQFGAGGDLQLQHNATNSSINNYTGNLEIVQNADDADIIFKCDDGSGGLATYLTIDGSVAKTEFAKHTSHKDSVKAYFGDGLDLSIFHDSNHSYISQEGTGHLYIRQTTADSDVILQCDNGSGSPTQYIQLDGSDVSTVIHTIKVLMPNLPTSDPSVAGQLWNDNGTLKIAAG